QSDVSSSIMHNHSHSSFFFLQTNQTADMSKTLEAATTAVGTLPPPHHQLPQQPIQFHARDSHQHHLHHVPHSHLQNRHSQPVFSSVQQAAGCITDCITDGMSPSLSLSRI